MEENQEITQQKLSNDKSKISIQLKLKINFKTDLNKINILQNNRIGIICNNSLIIYSLYNFTEISRIIPEFPKNENENDYHLKNYIELKNKDLVLWTSRIILFYSLYDAIYVYNIIELENGNLVVCIYQGIKLYTKTRVQYCFKYYYSTSYPIINSLGIKANRLILFKSKKEVFDF